jgi:hypothetical protein
MEGAGERSDLKPLALPKKKREAFERLRDMPDDPMDHSDDESPSTFNYDDVAEGNIHIDISHAGGEMGDLQDDLNEELNGKKYVHPKLFSLSAFVMTAAQETP